LAHNCNDIIFVDVLADHQTREDGPVATEQNRRTCGRIWLRPSGVASRLTAWPPKILVKRRARFIPVLDGPLPVYTSP